MNPHRTTREQFLERVRAALGRHAGAPLSEPAPAVDEALVRLATQDDDLIALFARGAAAVGMNIEQTDSAALATRLGKLIDELGAKTVVLGLGEKCDRFDVATVVMNAGAEIVPWQGALGADRQFDTDLGITDVVVGLAETGTLVVDTDAAHGRGQSLIPTNHIALVRASDIVPDMLDYYAQLADVPPSQLPSSVVFITGPSKTADIEGVLVTGVHGPEAVYILIITDA